MKSTATISTVKATKQLKMTVTGVVINRSNVTQLTDDHINSFASKEHWHKFTIENGASFEKEDVLQAVLYSINPLDLVPVKYTVEEKNSYFLARNCAAAIEKFCLKLLTPIKIGNKNEQVNLIIETCYMPVEEFKMNMQYHLKKAIEKRYDESKKGYIDLSSFHREPDLYEALFCPLSVPRFLLYVLSILKRVIDVTSLNLSNNFIEDLKPLEVLQEFEGLRCLNLSSNKISNLEYVKLIGTVSPALEEINFHQNPICKKFESEFEYVKCITKNIPSLKVLDGISIHFGIPNQQIWLCDMKSSLIVNEFITHYFTLFDGNRKALEFTYDKDALFSMASDQVLPQEFGLVINVNQSKTLLKINDGKKIMGPTHQKNHEIVKILCKLPASKHDSHSFKIDVTHFEETFLMLTMSGIFQEFQGIPKSKHFNRTFILKKVSKDEYKITNDMYHITDPTEEEVKNSFTCQIYHLNRIPKRYVSEEEEKNMIKIICRLTEMNHAYSKRCLQDCDWNMKKTLEVFIENYRNYNIPSEAFMD